MTGSLISFRIHDALLTRLSNDDDIERGLSTFADEMSSSAMILGELGVVLLPYGLLNSNRPVHPGLLSSDRRIRPRNVS